MKNNFAALVLIGAISYEPKTANATKLSLGMYENMRSSQNKKTQIKSGDLDDMLDTPSVFGTGSYSTEAPEGYSSSVDEVMDEQEKAAIKKKENAAKEAKELEQKNK